MEADDTPSPQEPSGEPGGEMPAAGARQATHNAIVSGATDEDRIWATMAYGLKLFAPILAPLVIYFVRKDQSRFVAYHAHQSLFLDLALIACSAAALGLAFVIQSFPVIGGLMMRQLVVTPWLMWVGVLILSILGAIRAYNGEAHRLPVLGKLAEERMEG